MMVLPKRAAQARRALVIGFGAVAVCVATGCSDSTTLVTKEVKGESVAIGNGTARTFVLTAHNQPSAMGIELSSTALDNLPTSMTEWTLALPAGTVAPPWDHVAIDWNPQGHEPIAIYGVPHFDFHFYAISPADQMTIAGGPDNTPVPAQDIPKDYQSQVMSVPMMGVHWADTLSSEFHGTPFDKTFIYGFYHGNMVFVEPMVTRTMLSGHPDVSAPVKQPSTFQKPGLYPNEYSVRYDPASQTVRITLESLKQR